MRLIKINNDTYINPEKIFCVTIQETTISIEHGYTSSLRPAFHIKFEMNNGTNFFTCKKTLHETQMDLQVIVNWINSDNNNILDCMNLEMEEN